MKFLPKNTTFSAPVFIPGFIFIAFVAAIATLAPEWTQQFLDTLKTETFSAFSWFYILIVSLFILFLLLLITSRLGDIRLGGDDETPEFPLLSWLAMLFAAGMGVGLMYFGVAEPLMHYAAPPAAGDARQQAMLHSFFHWGFHAWAIYGTIALALAYFGFRYKLPLSLRSTFYPLLKEKIYGPLGHIIDIAALLCTIFGITTTIGYGAMQMNAGLERIGLVSSHGFEPQAVIILVVVALAMLSAISGVGKGVRRLSEINMGLALLLMLFILCTGPTLHLLAALPENIGLYASNLVELSFRTFAYDDSKQGWFTGWTVLYWAWWFSWAPFVGLFIARISRGRTIREFIFGVLAIPSVFNMLWFTIFGNSALFIETHQNGALSATGAPPEKLLFEFLQLFPLPSLTSFIAVLVLALFFITSADSGILVLNNIASRGSRKPIPRWQSILWAIVLAALAIALLNSGGLAAVQAMTLVVALPFAFIMGLMCLSLLQGLRVDQQYSSQKFNPGSVFWSGLHWQDRLRRILLQPQREDMDKFLSDVVRPAMTTLQAELTEKYSLHATLREHGDNDPDPGLELIIEKGELRNFHYGVRIQKQETSAAVLENELLPNVRHKVAYTPVSYFKDGRPGYDVQYMRREELIADILKQYERYLSLLDNDAHQIMTREPEPV